MNLAKFVQAMGLVILVVLGTSADAKESLVIGSPYENNWQQDIHITTGDDPSVAKESLRFQYQISCGHRMGASESIYKSLSPLLLSDENPLVLKGASLAVIYFVSTRTQQFVFGTLADIKGRSNGKRVFVKSKDWDCNLYNAQVQSQKLSRPGANMKGIAK